MAEPIYESDELKKAITIHKANIDRFREAIETEQDTIADLKVYLRKAEEAGK
jgi:hypothetical protein